MAYSPSLTKATPASTRAIPMPDNTFPANATPGQHNFETCRQRFPAPPSPFHPHPLGAMSYASHLQKEYSGPYTSSYQPLRWTHPSTWSPPSGMNGMNVTARLPADYPMPRSTPHLPSPGPYCVPPLEGLSSDTRASSRSEWNPELASIHQPPTLVSSPPTLPSSPLSVPVNNKSQHSTSYEDFARHSRCQRAAQRAVQSETYALQGHKSPSRPSNRVRPSPLPMNNQRTASPVLASTPWWQGHYQSPKRGLDDELRRQIDKPQPQQQRNVLYLQQTMLKAAPAIQLQRCYPRNTTVSTGAEEGLETLSQKVERTQSDLERIRCDQEQLNSRIATETDIIALRTELIEQIRGEIQEELREAVRKEIKSMHMILKEEIMVLIRQEMTEPIHSKNEKIHLQPTTILDDLAKGSNTKSKAEVSDLEEQINGTAVLVDETMASQRKEMQDLTHGTSISFYLLCEELRTKIAQMNADFSQTLSRINGLESARLGAVETHIKEKFRDFEDMAWPKMTTDCERVEESEEE